MEISQEDGAKQHLTVVGPDVMQSGSRVIFLLVQRILGKLPANFSTNFDGEFFGLVFPGFQATQKIQAQNSHPELSAFLSNVTFLNPKFIHGDFLLTGETNSWGRVLDMYFGA